MASSGSTAPVFTLPAWAQTIAGPLRPPRADAHVERRRALHPIRFNVPPRPAQLLMAPCRERGEVRHVAAGDESDAGGRGKAQQIEEPGAGNFFDDGRGG